MAMQIKTKTRHHFPNNEIPKINFLINFYNKSAEEYVAWNRLQGIQNDTTI